jgi:hypothetical protein
MSSLARALGDTGSPFRWIDSRRSLMRAEVEAAVFHLYGIGRPDVEYIMDTFPVVKREDEAAHGTYRAKDLILDAYDRMEEARKTGDVYQTLLDPPPGHGPRHDA